MFKKLFGKKNEDSKYTAADVDKAYSRGYADAEAKAKRDTKVVDAVSKFAKDNDAPLTDKEKVKVKEIRHKLLTDIESILNNTPAQSVRGASIIKEDGKVKLLEINSKDEALNMVRRAKDGEIKIIM